MAQPSIASYFNARKRAAVLDDNASIKNKRLTDILDPSESDPISQDKDVANIKIITPSGMRTRSGRTVKRIGVEQLESLEIVPKKISRIEADIKQRKLVQFVRKGPLSPRKKPQTPVSQQKEVEKVDDESTPTTTTIASNAFATKDSAANVERGFKTPTKQIIKNSTPVKRGDLKSMVKKELNFDEVKTKISRSAKLQELKASLTRLKELENTRKEQEELNRRLREGKSPRAVAKQPIVQLKEFDKIELEVLTSPSKTFKTPTKLPPPAPDKNELMSPRQTNSKRVLFSPAKHGSPSKLVVPPAYQRFLNLAESSKAIQLCLPYKYRHLFEIFKAVDTVCAMFHNRKESITFKKLRPAVQRIVRKNFTEIHLAQIKHLFPDAYNFAQTKMRNYGSTSKADYFQLVITPKVDTVGGGDKSKPGKVDEDNVLTSAQTTSMNPRVITERMRHFQNVLLERVKEHHDKFLKSLDPPLLIPKEKVTRWHPDFDLENCPEIELGHLPQPPNVEKYSSARDILSTARNLFNCATPMERVMERYEAKLNADRIATENGMNAVTSTSHPKDTAALQDKCNLTATKSTGGIEPSIPPIPSATASVSATPTTAPDITSTLLKGVPKSLLEKIRAKQAAKALDAMTRRPSQDQEAVQYSRLPELARHLRNVFITERKGVLTLEVVLNKIQNSFRACLTHQEIESHLRMIAKELPDWVAFHEVRKTMYLKVAKDMDIGKITKRLETLANEKSK